VKVCLTIGIPCNVHRKVEVYYDRHLLHINSCQSESKREEDFTCLYSGSQNMGNVKY
jgi:hypothetical protein